MTAELAQLKALQTLTTKGGKELTVCRGWDMDVVDQLVEKSHEEDIRRRCHRDAEERFASRDSFLDWVGKGIGGRVLYPLLDTANGNEVGGVIWLGVSPFAKSWEKVQQAYPAADPRLLANAQWATEVFAMRTYESAGYTDEEGKRRGSGIGRAYMRECLVDYTGLRTSGMLAPGVPLRGVHLETDIDNGAARRTYEGLSPAGDDGFWVVGENPDKNRVAMVLPAFRFGEVLGVEVAA